jgi:hypothetical protein
MMSVTATKRRRNAACVEVQRRRGKSVWPSLSCCRPQPRLQGCYNCGMVWMLASISFFNHDYDFRLLTIILPLRHISFLAAKSSVGLVVHYLSPVDVPAPLASPIKTASHHGSMSPTAMVDVSSALRDSDSLLNMPMAHPIDCHPPRLSIAYYVD